MKNVPDDARAAIVVRVADFVGDQPAPGATRVPCDECGEDCWADPNTIRMKAAGEAIDAIVCMVCAEIVTPFDFIAKGLESKEGLHFHDFEAGGCECGMTEDEWAAMPQEAKDMHNAMKAIYDTMKDAQ